MARPAQIITATFRVSVDFPVDLSRAIDRGARRIGVTRQALITVRLSDTPTNS